MSDQKIKTASRKVPLDLIPLKALVGAARVFQYGAKKYAAGNFLLATVEDGAVARYMGALRRHMAELEDLDGCTWHPAKVDEESGLPHIDHMLCGLIMLRAILVAEDELVVDPGEGNDPPGA